MTNKHKASVQLISWGATIQAIKIPNQAGILGDVVLGFDDVEGEQYLSVQIWSNRGLYNCPIVTIFVKNIIRIFEEQVYREHDWPCRE